MAGQCLRGQPEAAWGSLHQVAPAGSHEAQAPEHALLAPAARHLIGELGGGRSRGGKITPISSGRMRPAIPLGGAGRGRGGECFAQGGDGGGHRSWLERQGGGGEPESLERSRRGERPRQVWVGLTDPGPGRLG
jgi:hypothetical protein